MGRASPLPAAAHRTRIRTRDSNHHIDPMTKANDTTAAAIPADKKRALSDLSCATRKLAELFRSCGYLTSATKIELALEDARRVYGYCRNELEAQQREAKA